LSKILLELPEDWFRLDRTRIADDVAARVGAEPRHADARNILVRVLGDAAVDHEVGDALFSAGYAGLDERGEPITAAVSLQVLPLSKGAEDVSKLVEGFQQEAPADPSIAAVDRVQLSQGAAVRLEELYIGELMPEVPYEGLSVSYILPLPEQQALAVLRFTTPFGRTTAALREVFERAASTLAVG
jgi:hypothetical protein